tara:strand:- start:1863 stop:2645 length:783 start_codon:yes stop_codon:yes gene_type:complete
MTLTHSTPTNQNTKPAKKIKFKVKSKKPSSITTTTNQNATLRRPSESLELNDNMIMNNTKPQKKKIQFKRKPKFIPEKQYSLFIDLCNKHSIPYFRFYDENNWRGPVAKIHQNDFEHIFDIFDAAQPYLRTIMLNGFGFAIVKPVQHLDDSNIIYPKLHFQSCKFTEEPLIPYNSDMEDDDDEDIDDDDIEMNDVTSNDSNCEDDDDEIIIEQEFIAEEWKYNGFTYLLDTTTNNLYFPSNLEFAGKKLGEFSVDFDAKE